MRVTIYLTDEQAELLEELCELEHRSARQQATVLVLQGLEGDARLQHVKLEPAVA